MFTLDKQSIEKEREKLTRERERKGERRTNEGDDNDVDSVLVETHFTPIFFHLNSFPYLDHRMNIQS